MVQASYTRGDVITALMNQFKVSDQQASHDISQARQAILQDYQMDKDDLKAQSFGFYSRMASNPRHKVADRIVARKSLDKLMGIWPTNYQLALQPPPTGDAFEQAKARKVAELTGMFAQQVIDQARAFEMPLPDDLKKLGETISSAINVTPGSPEQKARVKKGKAK
jgi:hypothetical protein